MNEEGLFMTEDQVKEMASEREETLVDAQKFLVFMTDDLRFGVDACYVVEIITNHVATGLPMLPEFIRGIINLRGQMIPILDIRLRLGKPQADNGLVIVLNIDGTRLGILVDAVDQMIDVPKSLLLPVPSHNTQQLVSGMCNLPDGSGTMMVLECAQLLPHDA